MAKVRDEKTGEQHPVPARMLVGRSASCFLRLVPTAVSGEHALIHYDGAQWWIRDLGSRNGTYVDTKRLEAGTKVAIRAGARIGFGAPEVTHVLSDDTLPGPIALELKSRRVVEGVGGLLALPSGREPEITIFQVEDGTWVQEADDPTQVEDQAVVYLQQEAWCVFLPGETTSTPLVHAEKTMAGVRFRFEVSRDEEHVVLTLLHGDNETRLEPREHHYVLLTLARSRRKDAELPEVERGWVSKEQLQRMLRMRANAMNVAIHRARQQLAEAGLVGAAGVVEVRRGLRRFGTDRFEERPLE